MAETPTAASVYAEQLICKGHGLPLWQPEPTKFGEVLIGDVGFVQSGQFFRLFNATQSADDPVNRDGVPEGFVPLQYNERTLEHTQPNYLRPGAVYNGQSTSCSVQAGIGLGAANLNLSGKYNFACNADRAAIAMLGGPGHHSQVLDNAFFRDYIAQYHESWYAFAVSRGLLVPAEDIILVYGWVKTSHWALAVCSSNAASHDISFEVPAVGTFASASFGVSVSNNSFNAVEQRSGPDNSWDTGPSLEAPAANDQCLFLRYYKLKSRWLRSPIVVTKVEAKDAHGAVSGTRPRGSSTSSSRSTESRKQDGSFTRALKNFTQKWSTSLTNRRNPESLAPAREDVLQRMGNVEQFPAIEPAGGHDKQLNDVLDYILANSEAHSAVICHDDLYAMFPTAEQWPSDVKGCLTGWKPSILVNDTQAGWLSPAAQVYQHPTPIDAIPGRLRSNRAQRHSASFTPTTHDSLSTASGSAQERTSSLETSTTLAGSATPASTLIESFTQGLGLVGTPIDYELDAPSNATKDDIVTLQIHPLLSCTNTHHAPIKYDVSLAPSEQTVLDRSASSPIPSHLLTQPATDPPSCERLVLRSAKLSWSVIVTPSKKSSPLQSYVSAENPITVADVLDAIYINMMATVTPEEMESLGRNTSAQQKVLKAYERRCLHRLGGVREGGVKRIDWLGGEIELVGVGMDTGAGHGNVGRIFLATP